uniref:Uncharacterized protein n=1 Tax=Tanacetum cinerariifolium TaxID=118510 RepID=A0A6L2NNX2_TANCI|nr:hypothetical protein [Tanacetum cinerariifolium]
MKIIIGHYMTNFPEISRRARDKYHNLKDDDIMKNIFNLGRYKDKVGMKIPAWTILEAMKHTEHYRMYAEVFRIDVPLTRSQSTKSTQGTYRTPSAPSSPNPQMDAVESSAPKRSTIIIGHYMTNFPEISRRARDKYHNLKDDDIMKNIFNLGRYKDKVGMKIPAWTILEAMKHTEHYRMYAEVFRIDVPLTRSQSTKSTQGTYRTPSAPSSPNPQMDAVESSAPKRSTVIHFLSLAEHKSKEEQEARENVELVNEHLASVEIKKMVEGQENVIDDSLISRNDEHNIPGTRLEPKIDKERPKVEFTNVVIPVNVNKEEEEITDKELQGRYGYLFKHLRARFMPRKSFATLADHLQEDDPHDDAYLERRIVQSSRRHLSIKHMCLESHRLDNEKEQGPSTSCNQVQVDDYDFWIESYASDDDEIPTKQVSQDIMKEVSLTIDEAKLKKIADEICQRDPEAPVLSLINQDLLYLKKRSSRPEKIVLSLHKFPVIIFNDDDIEERTFRWVNKKQKEPGKPKEVIYSNSKIIQVIKTYWELGHEHKFITKIVTRRANEYIVSITEPDFKNLNKIDIKDMYLLIMNGKERGHVFQLGIESYQQKVNLTAPTISFLGIKKHEMFSIVYEHVHGIIYKNSKKEKRVMRHSEIQKFCDAKLNKVLEGLKSYNNDVKIARTANPLVLVAQQQPVYHPQNYPTHYTHNSSTRSQQAATRKRGKAIVNSPQLIYDQEPSIVAEDDEMSKDKEIDKLMALISLSFKKRR